MVQSFFASVRFTVDSCSHNRSHSFQLGDNPVKDSVSASGQRLPADGYQDRIDRGNGEFKSRVFRCDQFAGFHGQSKKSDSPGWSTRRRGAILVLAAVFLAILFAFSAFAIDFSYVALCRTQLQVTADAAAMAGVVNLPQGPAAVRAAVKAAAANNKVGSYTLAVQDQDIQLGNWDSSTATFTVLSGTAESGADTVRTTCYLTKSRSTSIQLFFAPYLGTNYSELTTTATATKSSSRCGLIVGLPSVTMSSTSYTDSYDASQGAYSAAVAGTKGHVCSNGDIVMSGSATIHGDAHPGTGGTVKTSGSAGVTGKTTPLTSTIAYPAIAPGSAATTNDNKKIGLSTLGKNPLDAQGNFTLSGGDSITFPAGVYYFAKLTLSGGSFINIGGPTTIYATGDVNLSGGSVMNTTMLPKNLQLLVMGSKCDISGSTNFYGVVYGPSVAITRSGQSDYFGAIVGSALTLSGSGGIHADVSLDYAYLGAGGTKCKLVQ